MKRIHTLILFVFIVLTVFSQEDNQGFGPRIEAGDSIIMDLYSLPSPDEIMFYIAKGEVEYSSSLYNTYSPDHYKTSKSKLLAMGIYLSDMAYAVNYKKNNKALEIFANVETIGKQLNVFPSFPEKYRERLIRNLSNTDSLVAMYQDMYNLTMNHLDETFQYRKYTLISIGAFVESLYLVLNSKGEIVSKAFKRRVSDQKMIYDQLIAKIPIYVERSQRENMINDMSAVTEAFESIGAQSQQLSYKTRYDGAIRIWNKVESYDEIEGYDDLLNAVSELRNKWVSE